MDINRLIKAGVDYNQGVHRFNNNEAMYQKFLFRFPEDPNYGILKDTLEANDVKGAFRAAHTLKGVAGNLSIQQLYEAVIPLVEELRVDSMEKAPGLFEAVEKNYEEIVAVLKEVR